MGVVVKLDQNLASAAQRMKKVAAIAARHANAVDKEGRFPVETFDALKAERLMSVMIPLRFGGEGLTFGQTAELVNILSQACGSSGMIYSMHQIKTSSLVAHSDQSAWHQAYMREMVVEQYLLGSATTEGGIGGDLRNSICAIERHEDGTFSLTKEATCISYGAYSDAILITSRKDANAASSDQVMSLLKKGQYSLERTHDWDTLGMRGTCSEGFLFQGRAPQEQIFPQPFSEIAAQSMLAVTHIQWGGCWFGLAADAVNKAQAFVRAAARKSPSQVPPGALRLAEASVELQTFKHTVMAAAAQYEKVKDDPEALMAMSFLVEMNNLKIACSQMAASIIQQCMLICGLAGYKNNTPFSLARQWRDATSAVVMINNDRILGNSSKILLAASVDTRLSV